MTTQRFAQLRQAALVASKQMKRKGYVRRNALPRVTLQEHKYLCEHTPNIARFTRTFEHPASEFVSDVNRPGPARLPVVREFWVGARSQAQGGLGDTGDDDFGDDLPAGFKKSQSEQEDAAETTELMTLTYSDPTAYNAWIQVQVSLRYDQIVRKKPRLKKHGIRLRQLVEQQLRLEHSTFRDGQLTENMCMFEDPMTGEYRPIQPGDMITTVRGSNDDLDALFLEEADDPREQCDFSADGTDHRYSDRYRANTEAEQEMLQTSCFTGKDTVFTDTPDFPDTYDKEEARRFREEGRMRVYDETGLLRGYTTVTEEQWFKDPNRAIPHRARNLIPNSAMPEGTRWQPDDMEIRRQAQLSAIRLIKQRPELEHLQLQLTDEAEDRIRRQVADIKFGEQGELSHGYFVTRAEFFASLEENFLKRKRKGERPCSLPLGFSREVKGCPWPIRCLTNQPGFKPAKEQPQPMDWSAIGGCHLSPLNERSKLNLKPGQRWLKIGRNGEVSDITALGRKISGISTVPAMS